jgi:hypothetical protein
LAIRRPKISRPVYTFGDGRKRELKTFSQERPCLLTCLLMGEPAVDFTTLADRLFEANRL